MTPAETATNTVSAAAPNQNRGARQYSISGLDSAAAYDVALFPAEYITDTDGIITFRDIDGTANVADWVPPMASSRS